MIQLVGWNYGGKENVCMTIAVSNDLMRRSDSAEIACGTASTELMRRAGVAVMKAYPWKDGTVIVCGVGNNGGDGYVLALELQRKHISCGLVLLEERFSEDGRYYFEQCVKQNIPWEVFSARTDFSGATAIADCIFGTGFRGSAEGRAAELIGRMNESGKPIVSVDINSGLNGDNGLGTPCVHSVLTVAIGSYKYGHFLGNAKDVMKSRACVDIGIPVLNSADVCRVAEKNDFIGFFEKRLQNSHKGNYGYVGLLGGCAEYSGAAKLANLSCAALRSGCGVATLAVPHGIVNGVMPYLLESTLYPMSDDGAGHMVFDAAALDGFLKGKKAVAVGMGWGCAKDNQLILTYILENYQGSLVIDADGLNALACLDKRLLNRTHAKVVLTPHLKEFERLSGIPMGQILTDPVRYAREYAKEKGVCLLLKGACTIVTDGEDGWLIDRGCAGMATAGSGDVLSGILVGLLGYCSANTQTVACGAYLAGLAGELAEREKNPVSMMASDTVSHLSEAISLILKNKVDEA